MHFVNAQLARKRLGGETSSTNVVLQAQAVVVKEALSVERAQVERLERETAAEAEKRQQLLAKRRKTSLTASRQWVKDDESYHNLQSEIATVTAKLREWRQLTTETSEELSVALADVVQQLALQEAI